MSHDEEEEDIFWGFSYRVNPQYILPQAENCETLNLTEENRSTSKPGYSDTEPLATKEMSIFKVRKVKSDNQTYQLPKPLLLMLMPLRQHVVEEMRSLSLNSISD